MSGPRIQLVCPGGGGIGEHVDELFDALRAHDVDVEQVTRPTQDRGHVHFGNSTRSLLPSLLRTRELLVTVHDVLPRARLARAGLRLPLAAALRRHRIVVHSHHAAGMLHDHFGVEARAVIPLAFAASRSTVHVDFADSVKVTCAVAGQLRAHKGIEEFVAAVGDRPDVGLSLIGNRVDDAISPILDSLPPNVRWLRPDDHREFVGAIDAHDVLLVHRPTSIGEVSGPLAISRSVGVPVAALRGGGLDEYCGVDDLVLDNTTTPREMIEAVRARSWRRLAEHSAARITIDDAAIAYRDLYRSLGWS